MGKNTEVKISLKLGQVERKNKEAAKEALEIITNDLMNFSSAAAPVDEHILEGKYDDKYWEEGNRLLSSVTFSVNEGNYNYAFKVHEEHPIGGLGEKTKNKPLAQSGLTSKTYPAGGNYLKWSLTSCRKRIYKIFR